MKVLVTGAAGRVGANVVKQLRSLGIEIRAMVMPGDPHAAKLSVFPHVQIVTADLCNQSSVNAACQDVTHIVHLAAQMVRGDTPVDKFYDINAFSTLRLLEGALRLRGKLERFVLASTDSTYCPGNPPALPLTEDLKQQPADYYGTSKLLSETILRNRAVGEAAEDTAVGLVGPDGAPWRLSMIDVRDAAQGVRRALIEPGAVGRAFNIAAAEPTTHEEGASAVSEIFGVPKRIVQMPFTWRLDISIEAARQHIGYQPKYDYRSTLQAAKLEIFPPADEFIPAAEGESGVLAKLCGRHASSQS